MAKPPRNRNVTEPQHREIEQRLRKENSLGGSGSSSLSDLTDVILTSPVNLASLVYDTGSSTWIDHLLTLDDLGDVVITTPSSGQLLKRSGSNWVNGTLDLNSLTDVTLTAESDNDVLQFDFGLGVWVNQPIDLALNGLSDVTVAGAGTNQVLRYNGSVWVPATLSIPSAINDLSDVTITGATSGQHLEYNGSAWVNATPSTGSSRGMACYGPGTGSPQRLSTTAPAYIDWDTEQYDLNSEFTHSSGVIGLPAGKKVLVEWTMIVDNPEWQTPASDSDWAYMRWEESADGTSGWAAITVETTPFYIWSPHHDDQSGGMSSPSICIAGSFVYDTDAVGNVDYLRLVVNSNSAGTTIDVIACTLKLTVLE